MSSTLEYLILWLEAVLLRAVVKLFNSSLKRTPLAPDETIWVKPREGKSQHRLSVHVYRNEAARLAKKKGDKSAVLLHWHGGGFVLKMQGVDLWFFHHLLTSSSRPLTILDADYRHAPETPFPGPVEDAVDVLRWVLANVNGDFDTSKVVLSGFSAGATLALVSSSILGDMHDGASHPVRGVVAFYPATDAVTLRRRASECSAPKYWGTSTAAGVTIPDFALSFFVRSYFRGHKGAALRQAQQSPAASPLYADALTFPRDIMLVTCEYDTLRDEGEAFRAKFQDAINIRGKEIKNVAHSFDYFVRDPSERGWQERCQAYDEVAQFLHELFLVD